jgi:hypothetical protein
MLSFSVPSGYRRSHPSKRPKLDPFTGIIDQILEGIVRLTACRGGPGPVARQDDDACFPQLRWPPLPDRNHQQRCMALFRFPLSLRIVEEMLGCTRHRRQP